MESSNNQGTLNESKCIIDLSESEKAAILKNDIYSAGVVIGQTSSPESTHKVMDVKQTNDLIKPADNSSEATDLTTPQHEFEGLSDHLDPLMDELVQDYCSKDSLEMKTPGSPLKDSPDSPSSESYCSTNYPSGSDYDYDSDNLTSPVDVKEQSPARAILDSNSPSDLNPMEDCSSSAEAKCTVTSSTTSLPLTVHASLSDHLLDKVMQENYVKIDKVFKASGGNLESETGTSSGSTLHKVSEPMSTCNIPPDNIPLQHEAQASSNVADNLLDKVVEKNCVEIDRVFEKCSSETESLRNIRTDEQASMRTDGVKSDHKAQASSNISDDLLIKVIQRNCGKTDKVLDKCKNSLETKSSSQYISANQRQECRKSPSSSESDHSSDSDSSTDRGKVMIHSPSRTKHKSRMKSHSDSGGESVSRQKRKVRRKVSYRTKYSTSDSSEDSNSESSMKSEDEIFRTKHKRESRQNERSSVETRDRNSSTHTPNRQKQSPSRSKFKDKTHKKVYSNPKSTIDQGMLKRSVSKKSLVSSGSDSNTESSSEEDYLQSKHRTKSHSHARSSPDTRGSRRKSVSRETSVSNSDWKSLLEKDGQLPQTKTKHKSCKDIKSKVKSRDSESSTKSMDVKAKQPQRIRVKGKVKREFHSISHRQSGFEESQVSNDTDSESSMQSEGKNSQTKPTRKPRNDNSGSTETRQGESSSKFDKNNRSISRKGAVDRESTSHPHIGKHSQRCNKAPHSDAHSKASNKENQGTKQDSKKVASSTASREREGKRLSTGNRTDSNESKDTKAINSGAKKVVPQTRKAFSFDWKKQPALTEPCPAQNSVKSPDTVSLPCIGPTSAKRKKLENASCKSTPQSGRVDKLSQNGQYKRCAADDPDVRNRAVDLVERLSDQNQVLLK